MDIEGMVGLLIFIIKEYICTFLAYLTGGDIKASVLVVTRTYRASIESGFSETWVSYSMIQRDRIPTRFKVFK